MRTVLLSQVADINPKGPKAGSFSPDELFDFVTMASVSKEGRIAVDAQRPYSEVSKGFTAFQNNDVLVAKITPCFENNKIALAKVRTSQAFGSTEFHVVRPNCDQLDPNYAAYFLRQDRVRFTGEHQMTGSAGQRRVPKSFLEELNVPLPSLEVQKRIAAILDKADGLRRLRQTAITKLNALGQSIFYGIFGDVRSEDAANTTLGECAEFYSGSTLPVGELFVGQQGGYLILKVSDLNHPSNAQEVTQAASWSRIPGSQASTCPAGAIVFPKRGGAIGTNKKRVLMRPAILDPNLMGVSPNIEKMSTDFLSGWFSLFNLLDIASGSSVPQLNKKDLAPLKLRVPDLELQRRFSSHRKELQKIWQKMTDDMTLQEALFASLQHRAFRGEL